MSGILVTKFQGELDKIKAISGSLNEQTIRSAFRRLLSDWSRKNELFLLEELEYSTKIGTKVYPDGTIVHSLRIALGFWEAKDGKDDLDKEIASKTSKGYPVSNILYENSQIAILIQNGEEILRTDMTDRDGLVQLLNLFFSYEQPEIADFRKAVEQFKIDLPAVLQALRHRIQNAYEDNIEFKEAASAFLSHSKETINPTIGEADIREMLIQHILTEDIFNHVFNQSDFHRENNIARQLYELERLFFRGAVKQNTLRVIEPYYAAIRAAAASISAHSEKQTFLKVIYESFYKVYNPKAADRLGVVYTPNEIVRFMIDGTNWLCEKHFERELIDTNVDILDPCTGTGTYICEILESFRGDKSKLRHKFKHELHANELAILPYYVANLNIEATYSEIIGQYAEYPSLCFVDTLDNVAALGIHSGFQHDMFAGVSDENIARVKRQNDRNISIIIGNPPYNANQQNENDKNKNRDYARIDQSIKDTYVKRSIAQKTKVYDMYSRFFRWATDRLGDKGIVCFITNRSFIDSRTFDGFRADVTGDFDEIYIMDLGGDVRANPKLSGTTHNVFGIQTGVAITFMVRYDAIRRIRKQKLKPAKIRYARLPEMERAEDKLSFLRSNPLSHLEMEIIKPSKRGNWVNQVENEWDDLIPIASKAEKKGTKGSRDRAIFRLYSNGIVSARGEWIEGFNKLNVAKKSDYFMMKYQSELKRWKAHSKNKKFIDRKERLEKISDFVDREIKWTSELENHLDKNSNLSFHQSNLRQHAYRPYTKKIVYYDKIIVHRIYRQNEIFPISKVVKNLAIGFSGISSSKPFQALSINLLPSFDLLEKTQFLPRYSFSKSGKKIDNITNWSLRKFQEKYGKQIKKDDIFNYCYAVLHDPIYRKTYSINLKREFPRIPFYSNFETWVNWGKTLIALHIGYEEASHFKMKRVEVNHKRAEGSAPKPILKSRPENGEIILDVDTKLTEIPIKAWGYRLGNRSAIDWVLDQHKEKTPRDPTIREKFNKYRFADYKDHTIDLLARVIHVSLETTTITDAMENVDRDNWN